MHKPKTIYKLYFTGDNLEDALDNIMNLNQDATGIMLTKATDIVYELPEDVEPIS